MEKELIKIEKVTSKGKKYIVKIDTSDDEYQFSENEIVTNRIIKGAVFTFEDWQLILESQNTSLLFDKMLHFIDYKLRTKKEVIEKLREKKASDEDIDKIISRLINIGYLDDERFTSLFIEDSVRDLKGPYLIKFSLERKGIETSLINKYLDEIKQEVFDVYALTCASKYQKTVLNNPANKQKELIMQKLARNGYYMDTINKVVRNLTFEQDDLERLLEEYNKVFSRTGDKNKTITSLLQKGYSYSDIKRIINNK